jgi:hypothetical protein
MAEDGIQALRDEIAALRAEVALLRSQLAPQAFQPNAAARCTCGTTAGCYAHPRPWPGNVWISTAPAQGCAGGYTGHVYTVPVDGTPLNFYSQTFGAAGCAPTYTYTVPLS